MYSKPPGDILVEAKTTIINAPVLPVKVWIDESAYTVQKQVIAEIDKISKVESPSEQELAASAIKSLRDQIDMVDQSHKSAKAPAAEIVSNIDKTRRDFNEPYFFRIDKLTQLINGFQKRELARVDGEKKLRLQEMNRLADEAKKASEEAAKHPEVTIGTSIQGTSVDDMEAILAQERAVQAEIALRMAVHAPMPEVAKVKGMAVGPVLRYSITNDRELYKTHPHFFKLEPNKTVIKASIAKDFKATGIDVWEDIDTVVKR